MSFTLVVRQVPTRLAPRAPQLIRSALQNSKQSATRAFHQSTPKNAFFTSRTSALIAPKAATRNALLSKLKQGSRSYYQETAPPPPQTGASASLIRRLLVGGAMFGGTLVAINAIFNRETREDGGMPAYEREYLNNTFLHTGLGIGIIGITARQLVQSGFVYRIMMTNPWVVGIGGLALSIGTMFATRSVDPDK
jgi:growth hormone-inducible transmembrane protein